MIAVLAGLATAIAWACSTVSSAQSSRLIGAPAAIAWVMLIGLVPTVPLLVLSDRGPDGGDIVWLLVEGAGNLGGLLLSYRAMQLGAVGVIAPIISADGAIAAAIGLFAGERVAPLTAAALALTAAGIVATARGSADDGEATGSRSAAAIAIVGVLSLGVSLYALARVGESLPVGWALLPPRLAALCVLVVPMAARARLRLPRAAVPFVVAGALGEVVGFVTYTVAASDDVAVASVVSSLFGPVAVGMGWLFLGERLKPIQLLGAGLILAGLAGLALTTG